MSEHAKVVALTRRDSNNSDSDTTILVGSLNLDELSWTGLREVMLEVNVGGTSHKGRQLYDSLFGFFWNAGKVPVKGDEATLKHNFSTYVY